MTKPEYQQKDGHEANDSDSPSAIAAAYNDEIRPLLDAIDRLRNLKLSSEDIQLPTIVVVGDQSSGKSSVLESLAGISLPRGQGICTRVPLIMRLQEDLSADQPVIQLEHGDGLVVTTSEADVADSIRKATADIAGDGKGISDTPITLIVRKRGVPDLTLVDLPGITRVPVQGQPDDIYDQIAAMIKTYITPKETIILNVLSASVDFPTCESIRMSQQVDRTGHRTLAVVTKADKNPEGLLEKVTIDDVQIGLGYVCVRNRVGDESYDEARDEERRLFRDHALLSQIDTSMVGIPALAQRLTRIQAGIIGRCLPDIVKRINGRLAQYRQQCDTLPPALHSDSDALRVFLDIAKQVCASLEQVLVRGEFDLFPDDRNMHATARIREMLSDYERRLSVQAGRRDAEPFLTEEMTALAEAQGIHLPNFLPRSVFQTLLNKKIDDIKDAPQDLVVKVWDYVQNLILRIFLHHPHTYPHLQSSCRRAVQTLMDKMRVRSKKFVDELIEMESAADYTANPDYLRTWASILTAQDEFLGRMRNHEEPAMMTIEGIGEVNVAHLRESELEAVARAFDLKARVTAYSKCIQLRLIDGPALHILCNIKRIVKQNLMEQLLDEALRDNMEAVKRMRVPSADVVANSERLRKRITLLQESKKIVANIMDRIPPAHEAD